MAKLNGKALSDGRTANLEDVLRARDQELETLRAQLRLAHDEALAGDEKIMRLENVIVFEQTKHDLVAQQAKAYEGAYNDIFDAFKSFRARTVEVAFKRRKSRWFRLGQRLGFYP